MASHRVLDGRLSPIHQDLEMNAEDFSPLEIRSLGRRICVTQFYHGCYKISDIKKLKGRKIYFVSLFQIFSSSRQTEQLTLRQPESKERNA
jgi:hypothetical protein